MSRMIPFALLVLQLACSGSKDGGAPTPPASTHLLPEAIVGIAYVTDLEFSIGDVNSSYGISAGALPEGMALLGKRVQGIAEEPGLFGFEVQVRQAGSLEDLGRRIFTLVVAPDTQELKIWTRRLASARDTDFYAQRINTSGGRTPYRFSIGEGRLPAGLSLDADRGTIVGKPTSPGVYSLTIEVADSVGTKATRRLYIASLSSLWGRPLVALQLSRASGPAPLSIFFDGSGTRSTSYPRGFHDLHHDWRFDDPGSSRPSATGPLAGHVFERPGRYLVRLTATDPDGLTESAVYPITVEDPDVVFAGVKTVCFSNSNEFEGAPRGAVRVVTDSFDTAASHVAAGRRLLFRRGDTFRSNRSLVVVGGSPTSLGAFGPGKNPDRNGKFENNPRIVSDGAIPLLLRGSDIRIADLAFSEKPGKESVSAIRAQSQTDRCLILRVATEGYSNPIVISQEVVMKSKLPAHKEFTLADSVLRNARGDLVQMGGIEASVQGNTLTRSLSGHVLKMTFVRKVVIDGNILAQPAAGSHALQIHSLRDAAAKKVYGDASQEIVVRVNEIRGDAARLMMLGPRDKASNEVVREILVEKNRFLSERNVLTQLYVNGADTTIQNNLFLSQRATKGRALYGISITRRGIEPIPSGVRVFHNTFYDPGSAHSSNALVDIGTYSGKVLVFNNLAYAPLVKDTVIVRGRTLALEAGNLAGVDPGFLNEAKLNFRLKTGSVAIAGGVSAPVVDDYSGYLRDLSKSRRDVGALTGR